ncbi:hypothetical protein Patl1_01713 [Pistacia atlantica]|uniref:Uncharacterized protein n=1 Tax=Pistacia atlantica TaxID=434234 RepID=A0ACC1C9N6_9ROSI|nr:hypothetical protein Patl1_01713 [Pistacia atlantica]
MTSPKSKAPIHPFQATVSNLSNRNVLSEVNLRLTPAQLAKFKKTCFGKLLDITLKFQGALVHCMLPREVAKSDVQPFEMWFDLLGHAIRFSYHEFGLVSGLRFAPIPCESSYHFKEVEEVHVKDKAGEIIVKRKEVEKHRLRDLYFKGRERIKLREYKEKFNELDFYNIHDDDAVKLALILVLELFLCGRDKRRLIHPFHMQLVDDLDQFNAYPWGTFCWAWSYKSLHDALSGRLNKYADRSAKKNNDCKYNLAGCPFIFQAWVYEAIPYCNGLYGVKKSLPSIPRIVTWNTSKTIEYRDVQLRLFAADNMTCYGEDDIDQGATDIRSTEENTIDDVPVDQSRTQTADVGDGNVCADDHGDALLDKVPRTPIVHQASKKRPRPKPASEFMNHDDILESLFQRMEKHIHARI